MGGHKTISSTSREVVAAVPLSVWISPTSIYTPYEEWQDTPFLWDNNLSTYAICNVEPIEHSIVLDCLITPAIICPKIRFFCDLSQSGYFSTALVNVFYEGAWHNLGYFSITLGVWIEINTLATTRAVSKARVQFYNDDALDSHTCKFTEFQFLKVL